jgi:hypothetical protein
MSVNDHRLAADILRDWVERHTLSFRGGFIAAEGLTDKLTTVARPAGLLSPTDRAMLLKVADDIEHML